MAIMRAYEVASMHVSKACYINMYRNIDEPFRFNASLRHTLVTLVLIANTFSTFISLSFLSYFLHLILFLHCEIVFGYGPDSLNRNPLTLFIAIFFQGTSHLIFS